MTKVIKGIIIFLPFLLSSFSTLGQGARAFALSNANVCLKDEAAIFNNPAGAAQLKNISAICSYHSRFGLSSLSTIEAAALLPSKYGVIGIDMTRFGNSLYNESRLGIGYAHYVGNISLGVKTSYQQLHIEEYGTKGILVVEFGGIAEIIPNLYFGAHIFNLSQAAYSKEDKRIAPVIMKAGFGYKPIGKVLLVAEVEKNVKYNTQFKSGIEYNIIPKFFLRTGISTNPVNNSFGIGLFLKRIKIDYSLSSYQKLGFQHSFSITTGFISKRRG